MNPEILYSNPLNISNELLSLGNSQELQCIDTDTGNLISHIEIEIQGKLFSEIHLLFIYLVC